MSTEISEVSPPPYVLTQKMSIHFTAEQILELALEALAEHGHELNISSVSSTITKTGLTISAETVEGKAPPKTRRKRKPRAKKTEVKPKTTEKSKEAKPEEKGNNPFTPATDVEATKEETIADVKADAGVAYAPFSTAAMNIESSDSGEAPAANPFDFEEAK